MTGILSLNTANTFTFRELSKIYIGRCLSNLFPKQARNLYAAPTSYAEKLSDRLILAFLRNKARLQDDTRFFELLHREFWSGHGGAVFASNCDHRFEDVFLARQRHEFATLKSHWTHGNYQNLVEIGCCSGKLLQYMTTQLPGVLSSVGIDLNASQIQANRENPGFDSRIDFLCTDGFEYAMENAKPNTLFVTNGGVLEYFSRDQLDRMLYRISNDIGNCMFFTVEPVAPDHDWSKSFESIPFGEELSYSHNYQHLFESNGFLIKLQRHIDFDCWRWMATIALTP